MPLQIILAYLLKRLKHMLLIQDL